MHRNTGNNVSFGFHWYSYTYATAEFRRVNVRTNFSYWTPCGLLTVRITQLIIIFIIPTRSPQKQNKKHLVKNNVTLPGRQENN